MQAVRTHGGLSCLLRVGPGLALVSCQLLRPPAAPPPAELRPAPGADAARALEALPAPSLLGEWEHMPGSRPTALCRARELPDRFPPPAASRLRRLERILARRARRLDPAERRQVAEELLRAEKEMGLDPVLLLALIEQESSYDPRARGPRGSLGLMQVRPFVAEDVAARHGIPWDGPGTLHDPGLNVRIGVGYFAELKRMYTDDTLALAAYNMGPYRLKRLLARGRIPSSRYVFRVLERYHDLRREL